MGNCVFSQHECDGRHATLTWVLTTASLILISALGYLSHKVDSVQTDTTQIKVSMQKIEDELKIKNDKEVRFVGFDTIVKKQ